MRSVMAVVVLVAGFWLASSSGAAAGTYDVYGCRLPDGQPVASGGWSPYVTGNGTTTSSGCAIGGGLTGRLDPASTVLRNSVAGWVFDAPPDTTIENYSLYRSSATATAPSPDGHGRDIWLYHDAAYWEGASPSRYAQATCLRIGGCYGQGDPSSPLAPANLYARTGLRILRVFLVAQCDAPVQCLPTSQVSYVTIWAARVGLSDTSPPRFTREPTGFMPTRGVSADGERPITFAAEDRGGGIATVGFVVDGQLTQELSSQPVPSTCRRPYVTSTPCPLVLERTLAFDTTQISNGTHSIQVALTDVAGNRTLSAPIELEVRNRGGPKRGRRDAIRSARSVADDPRKRAPHFRRGLIWADPLDHGATGDA